MKKSTITLIVISFILFLVNCDNPSSSKKFKIFKNITERTVDGDTISIDVTDWGFSGDKGGIKPAYPNPTWNVPINLEFGLYKNSLVKIFILNESLDTIKTLLNTKLPAGYYVCKYDLSDEIETKLSSGIYRCTYIANDTIITGDISIKDYSNIKNNEYIDYADAYWSKSRYDSIAVKNSRITDSFIYELPEVKNELYYELIGKSKQFRFGWEDYNADQSDKTSYQNDYLEIWKASHSK